MLVKTYCAAVNGLEVNTVKVEISMARGVQFISQDLPILQ